MLILGSSFDLLRYDDNLGAWLLAYMCALVSWMIVVRSWQTLGGAGME